MWCEVATTGLKNLLSSTWSLHPSIVTVHGPPRLSTEPVKPLILIRIQLYSNEKQCGYLKNIWEIMEKKYLTCVECLRIYCICSIRKGGKHCENQGDFWIQVWGRIVFSFCDHGSGSDDGSGNLFVRSGCRINFISDMPHWQKYKLCLMQKHNITKLNI